MIRKYLIIGAAALLASVAIAAEVKLGWTPNSEPDIANYTIYGGRSPGNYPRSLRVSPNQFETINGEALVTHVVPDLVEGTTYFFAVTATNTAGVESTPSNEIMVEIPGFPSPTPAPMPDGEVTPPAAPQLLTVIEIRIYVDGTVNVYKDGKLVTGE